MKRRFESGTIRRQRKESTVAAGSGVASYGGTGARAPSNLGNSVHSASAASLTIRISKITKEKHVVQFRLSRQKHAKTHVNRLKQSQKNPWEGRRGKIQVVPLHLISWRRHWQQVA